MSASRSAPGSRAQGWLFGAALTCCLALVLGLATLAAAGSAPWLRGGLGLAGLVLVGASGGLLVAHLVLDERRNRPPRRE
jgi:hypothetical protein